MSPDLFTYEPPYPATPGFKARETSAAAADSVKPSAATLRAKCLDLLRLPQHQYGRTADEAAAIFNLSVLSIRPRFSELAADGKIEDTGHRRKNESGRSAIVWRATEMQQ